MDKKCMLCVDPEEMIRSRKCTSAHCNYMRERYKPPKPDKEWLIGGKNFRDW